MGAEMGRRERKSGDYRDVESVGGEGVQSVGQPRTVHQQESRGGGGGVRWEDTTRPTEGLSFIKYEPAADKKGYSSGGRRLLKKKKKQAPLSRYRRIITRAVSKHPELHNRTTVASATPTALDV